MIIFPNSTDYSRLKTVFWNIRVKILSRDIQIATENKFIIVRDLLNLMNCLIAEACTRDVTITTTPKPQDTTSGSASTITPPTQPKGLLITRVQKIRINANLIHIIIVLSLEWLWNEGVFLKIFSINSWKQNHYSMVLNWSIQQIYYEESLKTSIYKKTILQNTLPSLDERKCL